MQFNQNRPPKHVMTGTNGIFGSEVSKNDNIRVLVNQNYNKIDYFLYWTWSILLILKIIIDQNWTITLVDYNKMILMMQIKIIN